MTRLREEVVTRPSTDPSSLADISFRKIVSVGAVEQSPLRFCWLLVEGGQIWLRESGLSS
jgi:hypothetical protein